MNFTRREAIKTLAALPIFGSIGLPKRKFQFSSLFKTVDFTNLHWSYFGKVSCIFPKKICNKTGIKLHSMPLRFQDSDKKWNIYAEIHYNSDKKYYADDKILGDICVTSDTTLVPLSKEIKVNEKECWRAILAGVVDKNIMVFDSDTKPGNCTSRLKELMNNVMVDYEQSEPTELIILDEEQNRFIRELGVHSCRGKDKYCLLLSNKDFPFYILKEKDSFGLACLDMSGLVLGVY